MERTKNKHKGNPGLILCSDIHLREDTPECRVDDFQKALWDKIRFIKQLQEEHECPVFHAGDLFHHWKPSPYLLSLATMHLPAEFHTIYGQHDLPQHNHELRHKSGIYMLQTAGVLNVLKKGVHWGFPVVQPTANIFGRNVLVWHNLTYQGIKPFPGAKGGMASGILKKYPEYDLIVTGDNHIAFVEEYEGRLLVNPGSLTRQTANQINHKPRVYLWYPVSNTVQAIYLPIDETAVTRAHIQKTEERDARIEAFISQLDNDWEIALSFEENLKQFEKVNQISSKIMEIVYRAIDI